MNPSNLQPEGYQRRLCDSLLEKYLTLFGAVEVAGTMWSGKTWTSLAHGTSVTRLSRSGPRAAAEADPQTALLGARPHVIDEWQDVPPVWDAVRDEIDLSPAKGAFILTGSSNPKKTEVSHSGAGRIAKIRMRTMSLQERGLSSGAVSLAGLFEGSFEAQLVQQSLAPLASIICHGGWPALLAASIEDAPHYVDSYLDAVFDVNIPKFGLDGPLARKISNSLARNIGTAATFRTIASDAGLQEEASSEKTVAAYLNALSALYMVEEVTGWDAPIRSKSRLRTKPKRYFSDPSIAVSLLQVSPQKLLEDGQLFGLLFESLCMHDLAVYCSVLPQASPHSLHYYRDSDGLEIDAIIELRDGRWAAFEVKLGEAKVEDAFKNLTRLRKKIALNPAARNPQPEFVAVLVGAGEFARYDKAHDAYVIPLTALGA